MQAFYTCFLKFCLALNSYILFFVVAYMVLINFETYLVICRLDLSIESRIFYHFHCVIDSLASGCQIT